MLVRLIFISHFWFYCESSLIQIIWKCYAIRMMKAQGTAPMNGPK